MLTQKQIEEVINWMNSWEQLKNTAIPIRFKEDFSQKICKKTGKKCEFICVMIDCYLLNTEQEAHECDATEAK